MSEEKLLDKASEIAFVKLTEAGDKLEQLEEPYKTVAIVYSAQGIIDNGGLRYFFENDWPNNPPYSIFADAYERIGRADAAKALRDAAATFGISKPENDLEARRAFIEANYDKDAFQVQGWNDCICGDEQVWADLATWIRNQPAFKP